MMSIARTIIVLLLLSGGLLAQTSETLRRGMQFETEGNLEAAISVYEDILSTGRNTTILYRLASAYQRAGHLDKAIELLDNRLKRSPRDVTARNRLSDIYLAGGRTEEAEEQMRIILKANPNQGTYISVGQRYERMNQDERAQNIYLQGRKVLKDPGLFSRELAQIYERAEQYLDAVIAYGTLARQRPQFVSLVESKLQTIARQATDPAPLFNQLLNDVKAAQRDSRATKLFVTFAIEAGLSDQALQEILLLPLNAPTEGSLLRIGREALNYGEPGDAISAFQALIWRARNAPLAEQAGVGLAMAFDRAGRLEDAVSYYEKLGSTAGADGIREETAYRLGELHWRMGQPDSARTSLEALISGGQKSEWRTRSLDLLGDIRLRNGETDLAEQAYLRIAMEHRNKEAGNRAILKLARLQTANEDYGTAQQILNGVLSGGLASQTYNDAIELSFILETGTDEDPVGLNGFAKGLKLEGLGERSRAAELYLNTASKFPEKALTERLYKRGIEILLEDAAFVRVEPWARELAEFDTSLQSWAHFVLGTSLEMQGRTQEAVSTYEGLLFAFPETLEADRARERLTDLRESRSGQNKETG